MVVVGLVMFIEDVLGLKVVFEVFMFFSFFYSFVSWVWWFFVFRWSLELVLGGLRGLL